MSQSPHETRRVVERYVALHHTGDTSKVAEIIAPEFRFRSAAPLGVEAIVAGARTLHAAFTDLSVTLEQCVCEGDWAAFRFVISGTHTGTFAGRAPTGHRVTWSGADFVRLEHGKIVELWPVQEGLPLMEGSAP